MMSDGTLQISTGVTGQTITATTYLNGVVVQAGISMPEISGQHGSYVGNLTGTGAANSANFYIGTVLIASGVVAWNGTVEINNAALLGAVSSSSAPTAVQNATAVWQALVSGSDFTTEGSIGLLLVEGGGDSVQVSSFSPTALSQLAPKIQILTNVNPSGPMKCVEITSGDEISEEMGNAIPFTLTGAFPSLDGWTGLFLVERNGVTVEGIATIVSATNSQVVLSCSLPAGESIKLDEGEGMAQVRLSNAGNKWSILRKIKAVISAGLVANA